MSRPALPPTVRGLSLVSLFNDFASEMVYPLLPAFVTRTLGGGAALLGLLDGAADLTSAVLKWFTGRLADRPGWSKPLILAGYGTAVLIRPVIAVAGAAWQVIGFRVIDRIGKGIRTAPRDALIAAVTPSEIQGRAFGFHRGADHLGAVLGSLAAWYLLERAIPVRDVIGMSVIPGVVAFFVLLVVLRTARPARSAAPVPEERSAPTQDATGRVYWVPVLILAGLTFARLPEALLLLRLQDLGVAVPLIPLVWAGLHVVRTLASYPGGSLSDAIGPRWMVAAGGVVFVGVAYGLGQSLSVPGAVTLFLVLGLVAGLTESAERALVSRLSPRLTGRGFGGYHAAVGLTALPAAATFGGVYQHFGAHWALWGSAIAVGAMVVLWLGATGTAGKRER